MIWTRKPCISLAIKSNWPYFIINTELPHILVYFKVVIFSSELFEETARPTTSKLKTVWHQNYENNNWLLNICKTLPMIQSLELPGSWAQRARLMILMCGLTLSLLSILFSKLACDLARYYWSNESYVRFDTLFLSKLHETFGTLFLIPWKISWMMRLLWILKAVTLSIENNIIGTQNDKQLTTRYLNTSQNQRVAITYNSPDGFGHTCPLY